MAHRRTDAQIFLDTLRDLGGDQILIGNIALCRALDWDDEKYVRVRDGHAADGHITRGRGQGGSVMLVRKRSRSAPSVDTPRSAPEKSEGLSVFISYSHKDEALRELLVDHLALIDEALIETWHDGKIKPGDEWEPVLTSKLKTAQIILLLVSVDFLKSKYCKDVEMTHALERHDRGEAIVIPIILRDCLWKNTRLGKLQALPKSDPPVAERPNKDQVFSEIAKAVRDAAIAMQKKG